MKPTSLIVGVSGVPKPKAMMYSYFFYIHDRRYTVPSLIIMDAATDVKALELARQYLTQSLNYLSIDLVEGEREVGRVDRQAGA